MRIEALLAFREILVNVFYEFKCCIAFVIDKRIEVFDLNRQIPLSEEVIQELPVDSLLL